MKVCIKNLLDELNKDSVDAAPCLDFIKKQYANYMEYKAYCNGHNYKTVESFAVIPTTEAEFRYYNSSSFGSLLLSLEMQQPVQGQW